MVWHEAVSEQLEGIGGCFIDQGLNAERDETIVLKIGTAPIGVDRDRIGVWTGIVEALEPR